MKSSQALLFVAAAASSVFAAPAPGIVVNPAPSAIAVAMVAPRPSGVAALGTDVSANPAWTGDNTVRRVHLLLPLRFSATPPIFPQLTPHFPSS